MQASHLFPCSNLNIIVRMMQSWTWFGDQYNCDIDEETKHILRPNPVLLFSKLGRVFSAVTDVLHKTWLYSCSPLTQNICIYSV